MTPSVEERYAALSMAEIGYVAPIAMKALGAPVPQDYICECCGLTVSEVRQAEIWAYTHKQAILDALDTLTASRRKQLGLKTRKSVLASTYHIPRMQKLFKEDSK